MTRVRLPGATEANKSKGKGSKASAPVGEPDLEEGRVGQDEPRRTSTPRLELPLVLELLLERAEDGAGDGGAAVGGAAIVDRGAAAFGWRGSVVVQFEDRHLLRVSRALRLHRSLHRRLRRSLRRRVLRGGGVARAPLELAEARAEEGELLLGASALTARAREHVVRILRARRALREQLHLLLEGLHRLVECAEAEGVVARLELLGERCELLATARRLLTSLGEHGGFLERERRPRLCDDGVTRARTERCGAK